MRSEEKSARGPIEKEGTHEYCECHRVLGNIGHGLGLGPSSHGLFAFLGLLAIVAPFAAPFIRLPWSKYLNAAPLGFLLLSVPKFWWDARQAVGGAAGELGKAAKQG